MTPDTATIGDEESTRPRAARRHREVLAVACAAAVMAFLLEVLPDQRVAFRGLERYPLPPTCSSRTWFGVNCPGCGMTRSIVHLAHGDWRTSVRTHRLGWVAAAVLLFQIPYRALALRWPDRLAFGVRTETVLSALLIALLVGNWLYEIVATRPAP